MIIFFLFDSFKIYDRKKDALEFTIYKPLIKIYTQYFKNGSNSGNFDW
jgi:hypothetical protein